MPRAIVDVDVDAAALGRETLIAVINCLGHAARLATLAGRAAPPAA